MGRHSRRGPAPKADAADTATARENPTAWQARRRTTGPSQGPQGSPTAPTGGVPGGPSRGPQGPGQGPGQGSGPGPGQGARFPDGTPAQGAPGRPAGTPAHGVPRFTDGTPARGVPQARGGHPEQREPGGGWGELSGRPGTGHGAAAGPPPGAPAAPGRSPRPGTPFPRQRQVPPGGPRQEYLDAFGADHDVAGADHDVFAARPPRRTPGPERPADPYASVTDWSADDGGGGTPARPDTGADEEPPTGDPAPVKGAKGRTFTGIAAAAVTTVLAVVVAGQVADGSDGGDVRSQSATDQARGAHDSASRDDERPTPAASGAPAPLTYEQKMGKTYPLSATLKGSGKFDAIPGIAKGTGKGQRYTYRIDVEQGLGLDGELFADAVQKTLNDDRSWSHNGARTFERIESGQPNFVITLASPGTTAEWCAKSGLDTTEDNVSCDSAATARVMINAYRWAQGAAPYGDAIYAYRQMLINHEVGHRIGYNHVTCDKDGELAPVMQQQTKFVDHDGIDCRPNAWAYPNN
ncbi:MULTISPECIES: DUF3152 domain-containing protein [Streptomyces]|uniref:DUF3152 domain-containing protein n=1 Tax=Streptomyces lienomycini TaxID=284035 RepID=A0ABV9WUY8_9ACTN|nr:DUF3152 domain-containing protein [Streptomyces lienomycini]